MADRAANKIDLKKTLKHLYSPPREQFTVVDVPPMSFLMIDGAGDPNTSADYQGAVEALYSVAYALKFMVKRATGIDYAVMPLEGLWWTPDMAQFSLDDKDSWLWTMLVMQPDHVTLELVEAARTQVMRKKALPALDRLRLAHYHEGLSVQTLYLGAYADEGPTIAAMHRVISEKGYTLNGKHHEIYLSDFRRTAPEKLKTVIRQPVADPAVARPAQT